MQIWYPTLLNMGPSANFEWKMDDEEILLRELEKDPRWLNKSQWLQKGSELLDLVGEETVQWINTKFMTWSGAYAPYFELEDKRTLED